MYNMSGTPITKTSRVQEVPKSKEAPKSIVKPTDKDKDKSSGNIWLFGYFIVHYKVHIIY